MKVTRSVGPCDVGEPMATPILTIRGREISEPTLWIVGGLVAPFTPLGGVVMLPMFAVEALTGSYVFAAAPLLGRKGVAFGLHTRWVRAHPGRQSSRLWSVGAWLTAFGLTSIAVFGLLAWLDGAVVISDSIRSGLFQIVAPVIIFGASPLYAWSAFHLGQRLFSTPDGAGAPPEVALAS